MESTEPIAGKQPRRFILPLVYAAAFALWLILAPSFAYAVSEGGARVVAGITMGSYLALFIVFSVLFLIHKAYLINLFFAIACLTMFVQTGTMNYRYMPLPFTSFWEWLAGLRFDLVTIPVVVIVAVCIFHRVFPGVYQKWFLIAMYILMTAVSISFLLNIGNSLLIVGWIAVCVFAAAVLYSLVRLITKLRRVSLEQLVVLIGAFFVIYYIAGDVLSGIDNSFVTFFFPFMSAGVFTENALLMYSLIVSSVFLSATARGIRESGGETHRLKAAEMIAQSQLDFQREQFGQIMVNVESVKYMRHDMKHHFAVLSEYAQSGNIAGIKGYMEGLDYGLIASRGKIYCENYAVNAILTHYLSLVENDGFDIKIKLTVPADAGRVRDSDLCVVVGNLLDNAVEACRQAGGERFIRFYSYVEGNALTFTMENSFDGAAREEDGFFYSRKREGMGFGISSVKAVAARNGGAARFEAKGTMFLSSVYLVM